jgi:hypothetical protein
MKRFTMNMILAVAGMALAAGTASAQTMRAEVPFAFRVGSQVMLPGEYLVSVLPSLSGSQVLNLTNRDLKKTALIVPIPTGTPKEWSTKGAPRLRFACSDAPACTLTSLWLGEGDTFTFHPERAKNGESRIAEIALRPERAGD